MRKYLGYAGVAAALILVVSGGYVAYQFHSGKNPFEKFLKEGREEEGEEKETGIDKEMSMWWWSRAYPDPSLMEKKYMDAWNYAVIKRQNESGQTQDLGLTRNSGGGSSGGVVLGSPGGAWTSIGPNTGIGGRILTIAIDPVTDNTVFIGSASGGIWKSVNALAGTPTWTPVTTGFPTLGVTSIIIDPTNTNNIYAGTGEVYRMDSTVGTPNPSTTGFNTWKTRGTYGVGILKSTNGGATWSQVLIKTESSLFGIQRLRFDPNNFNIIYAAATDGLYKTVNAGTTWTQVLAMPYVSDVVIDKKNSNQIVIGVGNLDNTVKGVFRSTNGGTTWAKITSGLPATFKGYIKFDNNTSLGNRDTIFASIGVDESPATPNELYRSADFGTTWTALATSTHTSYQFWCAHNVAINPFATDSLTFAGVSIYSYKISVTTRKSIGGSVHSDIHDIQYDPIKRYAMYIACDGGIYRTTDGGASFTAINTGLYAVQFYSKVGVSSTNANNIIGGLQDNGVVAYNGTTWTSVLGADGAACFIDSNNDQNMLGSIDARGVSLSTSGASGLIPSGAVVLPYLGFTSDSRTAFVAPLAISKPKVAGNTYMYVGTDELFFSTNSGASWNATVVGTNYIDAQYKTAIALSVSSQSAKKLYVSTSPFSQYDNDADQIHVTGTTSVLRTLTGNRPFTTLNTGTNKLPNQYVMQFAISPSYDDSVWVALGGFGPSHVYLTTDGGVNWVSKDAGPASNGLPNVPANAIMIDPTNKNVIYVGTDLGVYVSPDRGLTWRDFNGGFWDATLVMDLEPLPGGKILAATHGKGAFTSVLYSVPLPVTLTSFTGAQVNNYNLLQWSVSKESALQEYDLERSTNGIDYTKIATIPAKNVNNSNYGYKDYLAGIQNTTDVSYRLKIFNLDGTFVYSNIVNIHLKLQPTLTITGNPFNSQITMNFTTLATQAAQVRLLDANGRLMVSRNFNVQAGNNTLTIPGTGSFAKGIYLLEFITPDQRFSRKLVKK